MADNVSITAGTGTPIATDDVGGVQYQRVKVSFGADGSASDVSSADPLPVTGAFYQTTQPVSIAVPVAVTGAFYQATQPISGSVSVSGPVAVTGTFWQATQPVSIAGTVAVSGGLTDTQLRATAVPVSGTFWQATQPVSGTVSISGTVPVSGTFWQATQPVSNAGTFAVQAAQSGTWNVGTVTTITNPVTITPPSLTKGTQGSTGVSVQQLKDAGRTLFSAATVIGGVTAVTTEALLSMVPTRAGVAAAGATTIAATSGKTLRITAMICGTRSSSAAVISGRVALRMNPSGSVAANSPIIAIATMSQQAAALAEAGDTCVIPFPDGIEISGTQQIGLSQVCSATTGVVYATLVGFEY